MRALFSRSVGAAVVVAAAVFATAGAASAETVTVIYRFAGGKDGANPHAGLTYLGGMLYGTTTAGGGGKGCSNGDAGCGTAFKMTLDGKEVARHPFAGGPDGAFPYGDLLAVGDTLYGTTFSGGDTGCGGAGCGTVFKLPQETVVRRFAGSPNDGANPVAGLTCRTSNATCSDTDGLFGTTVDGGVNNLGTMFELETKAPLYSFTAGGDGTQPYGSLDYDKLLGLFYGTTASGGDYTKCDDGCGTVFTRLHGQEVTVHPFKGGDDDGATPYGGLIALGGVLVGTTSAGGGTGCGGQGCGTVFEVDSNGGVFLLHKFQGGSKDGALPFAGLLYTANAAYGATQYGGGKGSCLFGGCGTLFKWKGSTVSAFYSFPGGAEGARPAGKLINVEGTLYGTTYAGGGTGCGGTGCGTVFKVTSP